MKKLLIVAYFFPPYGGVGGIRVAKLVKYLSKLNWKITVITVKEENYAGNLDYNKLDEIPDSVKIIRTDRLKRFTKFKEEGIYWSFNLYKQISKTLSKENFDYIYYTGGPFLHWHLIPKIKKRYGIEHILDFRDPWSLNPYYNSKFRKFSSENIEPKAIKTAKWVINVTESATELYLRKYKEEEQGKFLTISNGFDPDDFKNIEKKNLGCKENLKIVYAGKFGTFRDPLPFLKALKKYNENNDKQILFYHIGNKEDIINDFMASNPETANYIYQLGLQTYKDTLSYMKNCDIGLIISGGHPFEPTTKVYDYIALDIPILCINNINYGYLYEILKNYKSLYTKNSMIEIYNTLKNRNTILSNSTITTNKDSFNREKIFSEFNQLLSRDFKDV